MPEQAASMAHALAGSLQRFQLESGCVALLHTCTAGGSEGSGVLSIVISSLLLVAIRSSISMHAVIAVQFYTRAYKLFACLSSLAGQ